MSINGGSEMHKKINKVMGAVLVMTVSLCLLTIQEVAAQGGAKVDKALLLEKKIEISSETVNTKVMRVTFPPAYKTPWHTHEGQGPRYVVKGQLDVTDEGKTHRYSAGEVFWETGHLMAVENVGDGVAEIIIFELAPAK